ncbi:MAG TPA: hypothetical protein VGZ25_16900, partial [Gemmataceae bacterium]|nr:hypothetical protein [Gemmataceae bacterium]
AFLAALAKILAGLDRTLYPLSSRSYSADAQFFNQRKLCTCLYTFMHFLGFQRFVSALEEILLPDEPPIANMPRINALPISKDRLQKLIIRGNRRGSASIQPVKPLTPPRFQSIKPTRSR